MLDMIWRIRMRWDYSSPSDLTFSRILSLLLNLLALWWTPEVICSRSDDGSESHDVIVEDDHPEDIKHVQLRFRNSSTRNE